MEEGHRRVAAYLNPSLQPTPRTARLMAIVMPSMDRGHDP